MRCLLIALSLMLGPAACSQAQIGIGVATPGLAIGIDIPVYPDLVRVPGYPVYYYPDAGTNYFFYDGLYWVFQGDNWYRSSGYNGPWQWVGPEYVPLYVLRVPVRYYRYPPPYFRNWHADRPPRWGDHWGHEWEARRPGWDHWDPHTAPPPAPLPHYQRQYSGNRYPGTVEQQRAIRSPHDIPPSGQQWQRNDLQQQQQQRQLQQEQQHQQQQRQQQQEQQHQQQRQLQQEQQHQQQRQL
ncbi:MAG: hypothetical protein ACN6N0_16705, partial [Microvirgula sp.]